MSLIDPNTKAGKICMILGDIGWILRKMKPRQISILVEKSGEILEFISRISLTSVKEDVSLKCLRRIAQIWGWTGEQQDRIGKKMVAVKTVKQIWSKPDAELFNTDRSRVGEVTFTSEKLPFSFEDISRYKVLTQKDLFPHIDFTLEKNRLQAIQRLIREIDKLNKVSGGKRYCFTGFDYMEFAHTNENKIPSFIKDRCWYNHLGANFREQSGRLVIPCSRRQGPRFQRNGRYVTDDLGSIDLFLIIEFVYP